MGGQQWLPSYFFQYKFALRSETRNDFNMTMKMNSNIRSSHYGKDIPSLKFFKLPIYFHISCSDFLFINIVCPLHILFYHLTFINFNFPVFSKQTAWLTPIQLLENAVKYGDIKAAIAYALCFSIFTFKWIMFMQAQNLRCNSIREHVIFCRLGSHCCNLIFI